MKGKSTSPIAYLEGIYVAEEYRNHGWAREMGCTEFASDCEHDNAASLNFHLAVGSEEVKRLICFKKDL